MPCSTSLEKKNYRTIRNDPEWVGSGDIAALYNNDRF
jgi:hypothetical protein